ncbi:MAG: hypothetical protein PHU04_05125 [Candidatus Peribacteraceae bacterium]|nr:hypothetical protein [Candidatus Peribacteraceae bacterium]
MADLETARAIYEEEAGREQSAASLAETLRRRAQEVRQGELQQEQEEIAGETKEQIAQVLEDGAKDLQRTLGSSNPTIKDLPGDIAGQAQLGVRGSMEIDADAIVSDGPELIDTETAEAVRLHEERHEQQRQGDAAGVQVGETYVSAHELYEWDAMEHETGTMAHSADYEAIRSRVSAVLSSADRSLILQGRFRDLEAQKSRAIAA